MQRKYLSGVKLLFALVLAFACAPSGAEVAVAEHVFRGGSAADREKYIALGYGRSYPDDPAWKARAYELSTAGRVFAIWLPGRMDPSGEVWKSRAGMIKPSRANWFQDGFIDLIIGGRPASDFPAEPVSVVSGDDRGSVSIKWLHPEAEVEMEFSLLSGDDKLLVRTTVTPESAIPSYAIRLIAYPGSYGGGYGPGREHRDREAATPERVIQRPASEDNLGHSTLALEPGEPWVLFYDKNFDVGEGQGEGPCAVMFSPDEASRAVVSVRNYECILTLSYPGTDGPSVSHLLLWDFSGMSNQSALEYMQSLDFVHE